ncbi:MAG: type IV pili twitching motility protein PilT [Candidatus Zambryskibacteria bacterium CG_4_9_14_3_um_filter_40_16]|uniref:Type IV pili twitching motility protein PilT n=1 Tax=Candidatus Zambryskibacteria bacterium CG_4_9_14_3_um_filter_40_16 TaxID=1975111 RepID=A0A2M7WV81_9BACT|nr:MAG: type IV pili twitching motility protein PilT [Candidatus Zambryskibacteria bacterium CG_4_9_14_3_um_filter_40_16]
MDQGKLLDQLIDTVVKEGGSDIHLSEDRSPAIRVSGILVPLVKLAPMTREQMEGLLSLLMTPENKKNFFELKEIDFGISKNNARFRGNAFYRLGKISIALRLIPSKIRTLKELNLPEILEFFAKKQQGFFLVVGPTGHGKSTTLATLIDMINSDRLEHIVTIEDPVEYIFEPKKSIIDQREVKVDTVGFHRALKSIFRQDVDVLMIGEMRDPETIATAVTAAETGHLVLSTLHTNTAAQTIDRIIDSFPADQQDQIRVQLAASLAGIFSQRLVPRISGGLIPAYEILLNNSAVANLIRDKRTHEINTVIETSSGDGMVDLNRSLANLVQNGEITVENAYLFSTNPKMLEKII